MIRCTEDARSWNHLAGKESLHRFQKENQLHPTTRSRSTRQAITCWLNIYSYALDRSTAHLPPPAPFASVLCMSYHRPSQSDTESSALRRSAAVRQHINKNPVFSSIILALTEEISIISLVITNVNAFFSPLLLTVISISVPTGPLISSTASVSDFP